MKKVVMICLLVAGFTLQAQPPHGKEGHRKEMREKMQQLSPQQQAELKTKKMALHLNLSEKQQAEILKLNLENATNRGKNKPEKKKEGEISSDEIFQRTSGMLDEKIATKRKLQSILSKEQFEKFEKSHPKKGCDRKRHLGRKKR